MFVVIVSAAADTVNAGLAVRIAHVAASDRVAAVKEAVRSGGRGGGPAVGLHPVSHGLHHGGATDANGCARGGRGGEKRAG